MKIVDTQAVRSGESWRRKRHRWVPSMPSGELPRVTILTLRSMLAGLHDRYYETYYPQGQYAKVGERMGVLVGRFIEATPDHWIVEVQDFEECVYQNTGLTHATMDTRAAIDAEQRAKKRSGAESLVGWYHTHPGMRLFLSPEDLDTYRACFPQPWHVAMVFDPASWTASYFYRDLEAIAPEQGNWREFGIIAEREKAPARPGVSPVVSPDFELGLRDGQTRADYKAYSPEELAETVAIVPPQSTPRPKPKAKPAPVEAEAPPPPLDRELDLEETGPLQPVGRLGAIRWRELLRNPLAIAALTSVVLLATFARVYSCYLHAPNETPPAVVAPPPTVGPVPKVYVFDLEAGRVDRTLGEVELTVDDTQSALRADDTAAVVRKALTFREAEELGRDAKATLEKAADLVHVRVLREAAPAAAETILLRFTDVSTPADGETERRTISCKSVDFELVSELRELRPNDIDAAPTGAVKRVRGRCTVIRTARPESAANAAFESLAVDIKRPIAGSTATRVTVTVRDQSLAGKFWACPGGAVTKETRERVKGFSAYLVDERTLDGDKSWRGKLELSECRSPEATLRLEWSKDVWQKAKTKRRVLRIQFAGKPDPWTRTPEEIYD